MLLEVFSEAHLLDLDGRAANPDIVEPLGCHAIKVIIYAWGMLMGLEMLLISEDGMAASELNIPGFSPRFGGAFQCGHPVINSRKSTMTDGM